MSLRQLAARDRRIAAAESAFARPIEEHRSNGEGEDFPFIFNYSKGMPHVDTGVVRPDAYLALLRSLSTQRWEDFESIPLGVEQDARRFVNPQAGLGFDLEGPDPHGVALAPAPRADSPQCSAEMVELYWMSLLRDVPFADYGTDRTVAQAVAEISRLSDFRGPKEDGQVTPQTLFRNGIHGDLRGPFVSQFLLRDIRFGTLLVSQRQDTVESNRDYVTDWDTWLAVQNGKSQPEADHDHGERRYITRARDLTNYVYDDVLYQAYLNAAMILLNMDAILDFSMPYVDFSRNQTGFATFGPAHLQTLVAEVAVRALRAVWYSKWFVHRRMRPEEFAGRIHAHKEGIGSFPMIDAEVLDSSALEASHRRHKSYLLSQAYPEGSPLHPAYGSGHAAVAGACVTVLKAWFCESFELPDPVVPNESGTRLVPYEGPETLFAGGELNKLAMNIVAARNMAGIHWRTDGVEALQLGETVAIEFLREHLAETHEEARFALTRFDGTAVDV